MIFTGNYYSNKPLILLEHGRFGTRKIIDLLEVMRISADFFAKFEF
jgi:hypothetical protein